MNLSRFLAMAVVTSTLTACSGNDNASCSSLGAADPGIQFNFDSIVDSHPRQRLVVTACLLDASGKQILSCKKTRLRTGRSPGGPQGALTVGRDTVDEDTGTIIARLTIDEATGERLFKDKTLVTPSVSEPNGDGCPGKSWFGSVSAKSSRLQEDVYE